MLAGYNLGVEMEWDTIELWRLVFGSRYLMMVPCVAVCRLVVKLHDFAPAYFWHSAFDLASGLAVACFGFALPSISTINEVLFISTSLIASWFLVLWRYLHLHLQANGSFIIKSLELNTVA